MRKLLRTLFFSSLLLWYTFVPSNATILNIPGDYDSIQAAIDNCEPGDTILLSRRTYPENLNITGHSLTLAGPFLLSNDHRDISETIILANDEDRHNMRGMLISGVEDTVRIVGITFTEGCTGSDGGAIYAENSNISMSLCKFNDNTAFQGGAVAVHNSYLSMHGCFFSRNSATTRGGLFVNESICAVDSCTFYDNQASHQEGGFGAFLSSGILRRSVFDNNSGGEYCGGGGTIEGGDWIVEENLFIKNSASRQGAYCASATQMNGTGTLVIRNNRFINNHAIRMNDEGGRAGALKVIYDFETVEIYGNYFEGNVADLSGGAIYFSDDLIFHHNIFINNRADRGGTLMIPTASVNHDYTIIGHHNLFLNTYPRMEQYSGMPAALSVSSNAGLILYNNDFIGNDSSAVYTSAAQNHGELSIMDNYWGDPTGPFHATSNPHGMGDSIHYWIEVPDTFRFATTPFTDYRGPNIRVLERYHDFGLVEAGYQRNWFIRIRNGGTEDLEILNITNDTDIFELNPPTDSVLATGEAAMVNVRFLPETDGFYESIVEVRTNSPYDTLVTVILHGEGTTTGIQGVADDGLPQVFNLSDPYPNPVNSRARMWVSLPERAQPNLYVFDLLGRRVKTLPFPAKAAGIHYASFDTRGLASGIYFVSMDVPGKYKTVKKILVLK